MKCYICKHEEGTARKLMGGVVIHLCDKHAITTNEKLYEYIEDWNKLQIAKLNHRTALEQIPLGKSCNEEEMVDILNTLADCYKIADGRVVKVLESLMEEVKWEQQR